MDMASNQKNTKAGQTESSIKIQDLLYKCLSKWMWFVLSLAVTLGAAVIYLARTPSVYTRTASVLIKDDSKGKSASDADIFSDLGLFQSSTNVNNELIAFQSPALIADVVRRLNLCMNCYMPEKYHRQDVYGPALPVNVLMTDFPEKETAEFTMEVRPDSVMVLSHFARNGSEISGKVVIGRLFDTVDTPIGAISVTPTPNYREGGAYTLSVNKSTLGETVASCSSKLTVALDSDKSSVIDLTYKDTSPERAENVLNMLINVYNENWVKDKNQVAVSTSKFINERLSVIERELGTVDEDISSYKSENLLPDVQAASNMYMAQSNATNSQILSLNNRLSITRYVRDYLADEANRTQLLPVNSGIESSTIETQIGEYNRQLLQRNSLVSNSSEENPLVVDMDRTLSAMRKGIYTSIDNQIVVLNEQIKSLQETEQQTTSRLAANPTQAKYLLSVERQQKVKESLYLFLLQKREENELSQAFTAYNTRIVTPPHGSSAPTSPVRRNIFLAAVIIGLLIPVTAIFIIECMNTRIRGRKDLENLSVPFIGEIPMFKRTHRLFRSRKRDNTVDVIVKEGSRDIVNEAFRVARTNLEFMTGKDEVCNVIAVTSFNPGSGKTFLSMNLAASLAIKGKRVLVIDGDLRRRTASARLGFPKAGLSGWLAGRIGDLSEIIIPDTAQECLDIMPAGRIPPNPTELLFSDRLREAIEYARGLYDYVFIDCTPVEIVADMQIIEKFADRTIFVVRAGLLERSMLGEIERIYNDGKYKNMCLILNGTEGGGDYRYGYHYGYGSGRGYGYYYGSRRS